MDVSPDSIHLKADDEAAFLALPASERRRLRERAILLCAQKLHRLDKTDCEIRQSDGTRAFVAQTLYAHAAQIICQTYNDGHVALVDVAPVDVTSVYQMIGDTFDDTFTDSSGALI